MDGNGSIDESELFTNLQEYLNGTNPIVKDTDEDGMDDGWEDYFLLDPLDSADSVVLPLKAGSIAVFSSLTPHSTGPNLNNNIRKAYILQYAPEGSERLVSNSLTQEVNEEPRQYFVLKDGRRV